MVSITVRTENGLAKKIFTHEILLADALLAMGHTIKKPCGGKGVCGSCKIKASGALVPPPENGFALACKSKVCGEVYVDLTTFPGETESISEGIMPSFDFNPIADCGYGAAVDIGTTSIAAYIYKFPECKCVKTTCAENPQTLFGADVLTRIGFAKENLALLSSLVRDKILEMLSGYDIKKTVITGNTVMLHLYLGLDPSGMAQFPFEPKCLFGQWLGDTYFMPCITSYIGADIAASVLASGMTKNKTSLLADLGTNGEIVLWHDGRLICCSCSAGPAFEAVGIKNGVSSVPGAINHVDQNGFTTIGGISPIGICGSGLADAIAYLLDSGLVDSSGHLETETEIHHSGIYIFPDDVRLFQLAKSAVRSAIDTLLDFEGLSYKDIDTFCLAGGLGSCLSTYSVVKTGLIPHELAEKVITLGNAAGTGAAMLLLNKDFIPQAEQLAKSATLLELAGNDNFADKYIKNMFF